MLSIDSSNDRNIAMERQDFVVAGLTGTRPKFDALIDCIKSGLQSYVPGILGIFQFEGAGQAYEPVTSDCVHLIIGKQQGQKELLLEHFAKDVGLRNKYENKTLLLASNDINTTVEDIPLTKSPLQKESKLDIFEYSDLITASLKYLAMNRAGIKIGFTWKRMQSRKELIDKCLDMKWQDRVFLPIDYQSIDAFDLEKLEISENKPKLIRQGPTIAVINRAYATLELDFRNGNRLVEGIVQNYLDENWNKPDFTPDRYPLGIQQKELLKSFAIAKQHVLVSDHIECNGVNLKELAPVNVGLMNDTLERIEKLMNGYDRNSIDIARKKYANMKLYEKDYLFVITRKPGGNDRTMRSLLPKWKR